MIIVTVVTILLLGMLLAQLRTATASADRFARRRLTAPLGPSADGRLRRALVRRTQARAIGGTCAGIGVLVNQWLSTDDPLGRDDLLPRLALVLASVVLAGTLAETVVAVRDAPPAPTGVRVARLAARDAHLSRREARAEVGILAITSVVLVVAVVALAADVEHAQGAVTCLVAALGLAVTVIVVRRRVLDQPQPAGDDAAARVHRLLTAASADRFSESLVVTVAVLTACPVLMLLPQATALWGALGVLTIVALVALAVMAFSARSRAQVAA